MQNQAMPGICRHTLESYLEAHLRRIRGCVWCWRWVKGCKIIICVTTSSHPTTSLLNFKRESWSFLEQAEEISQNLLVKFWRCRADLCIPQYLLSLRKQQLFHTAQSEARMSLQWIQCTKEDKKPQLILHYNPTKRGVDNLDKVTATYSCQSKTAC